MEIKTIIKPLNFAEEFDRAVNESMKEGFILTRRYVFDGFGIPGMGTYYEPSFCAELERRVPLLNKEKMKVEGEE